MIDTLRRYSSPPSFPPEGGHGSVALPCRAILPPPSFPPAGGDVRVPKALRIVSICTLLVFAVMPVDSVLAQDDPTTGERYWVVDFKAHSLRMIAPKRGAGAGGVYWYLLYTLKNTTGIDRELYVNVTATTDGKKKYADLFLPAVERAAETKEGRRFWGKTDQYAILAKRDPKDPKYNYFTLKTGEETRCIAVFNRIDPTANQISVRIAGLSGDVREQTREDGVKVLVERIRELSFERPGDEFAISQDSFRLKDRRWIKREVSLASADGSGI